MVKRVFITSDLGEDALPKWASWLKVVVDGTYGSNTAYLDTSLTWRVDVADDLPLNVSRETLQSNRFLKQLQSIIVKRLLQTLARITENEEDELEAWQVTHIYNNVFKLGAIEDTKNREKLAALVKLPTNQRNETTLDQVRTVVHVKAFGHSYFCASTLSTGSKVRSKSSILPTWASHQRT